MTVTSIKLFRARATTLLRLSASLKAILVGLVAWGLAVGRVLAQPTNAAAPVYLFSTFQEGTQDGLRFAFSYDGYHWSNVPGVFLKAHVGSKIMRDPSIVRGPDGTWHLVWTSAWRGDPGFGYAHSKDLVHWSEQQFIPVMASEPTTVNVWAPELFYDEPGKQFVICWAATIPGRFPDQLEARDNNHRMYFTTTRDFKTFAPTQLFLDPGFSVIDCQIVRDGQRGYVLILKDNTRPQRNLRVAFGDSPLGPWRDISPPFTAQLTEGPTSLKLGADWLIYLDSYGTTNYGAMRTRDFRTFTEVTDQMTFPKGLKHGTIFRATKQDLDYLWKVSNSMVAGVSHKFVPHLPPAEIAARRAAIDVVARRGPFQPNWASITNGFKLPEWYRDAKFGLFIHWGAYAVPAFGSEWYPRNMYVTNTPEFAHHVATYGPHTKFGYKDFFPLFRAEKFDAPAWAKLFQEAGVKYVVPVAEHHDGFPMYDSALTDWTAKKIGPGRDLLGEQAKAFRQAGIVFGASSHRAEHFFFFDHGMYFDSDVRDPQFASLYGPAHNKRAAESQAEPPDQAFLDDWLLRSCEIVDQYRPQVVYFDWWICQPTFQPYLQTFAAYYYNRGVEWKKQVAINFKEWEGISFPRGAGVFDMERGAAADIQPEFWQTCTSVSRNSWGYITNHIYKDPGEIVDELVDVVSKNGTMLLNIGPKADGTIPEREQEMLREIGAWLKINGAAIYGTRPWKQFGEGPTQVASGSFTDQAEKKAFTAADFRFTTKAETLYAIALAWPKEGRFVVKSLAANANKIKRVRLLGHAGQLDWAQTAAGLVVQLPPLPPGDFAFTLEISGLKLN